MKKRKVGDPQASALRGPRYLYIHAVLRDWIYQGRYRPGSQLPTEDTICRMFGVSRITTRKALALLAEHGFEHDASAEKSSHFIAFRKV